jgi:hypothetical protein
LSENSLSQILLFVNIENHSLIHSAEKCPKSIPKNQTEASFLKVTVYSHVSNVAGTEFNLSVNSSSTSAIFSSENSNFLLLDLYKYSSSFFQFKSPESPI